ncbi:MAG: DUF3467 domain-containing protein [Bacteroidales bacterium]|nr:DUF3467 domain-containing protein [Bacteroidales bacterium]
MENKEQNIDIAVSDEVAEGTYSNLAIITHSNSEFILDFVNIMPGMRKGNVKSRIILTPQHAKRLLNALQDNINRYESFHGLIQETGDHGGMPLNLNGSQGEA